MKPVRPRLAIGYAGLPIAPFSGRSSRGGIGLAAQDLRHGGGGSQELAAVLHLHLENGD